MRDTGACLKTQGTQRLTGGKEVHRTYLATSGTLGYTWIHRSIQGCTGDTVEPRANVEAQNNTGCTWRYRGTERVHLEA